MIMICPKCGSKYESDNNSTQCPNCMEKAHLVSDNEIRVGNILRFLDKDNLRSVGRKLLFALIPVFLIAVLFVGLFTDDEINKALIPIMIIVFISSALLGRKMRFVFPQIPAFLVYFLTGIVLMLAVVYLLIIFGFDRESIRYVFGGSFPARFLWISLFNLGPAILFSKI